MAIHDALTNSPSDGAAHQIHSPGYSVADVATMNTISTGSAGDLCFVQSSGSYYAYTGSAWLPLNVGINRSGATANGNLVVWNGSNTDSIRDGGAPSSSALTLLEQHTASNSVALNFTTCISASYDTYLIEFMQIYITTGQSLLMRMSSDGGASYDAGNNYSFLEWRFVTGGGNAVGGATAQAQYTINSPSDTASGGASLGINGFVKMYDPGSALFTCMMGEIMYSNSSGNRERLMNSGIHEVTAAQNAFRITASSGSVTSGTVRVYGLAK